MDHSIETGLSFGTASGVITTLGLMVGLHSGTNSAVAVLGGILTIAVADAFSDSLGIHISEESECKHTVKEVWESTIATFISKFFFAATFIIPVILFELSQAMLISIVWGMLLLCVMSYFIARQQNARPEKVISEHLAIAIAVIVITHFTGDFVASVFA